MTSHNFIIFLDSSDVKEIHEMVIERFGGRSGIHSEELLESAVNHPWMTIKYGENEDREIYHLAAIYFFHLIKNHPFTDGNKRTGLLATIEFLAQNDYELHADFDDLYQLAVGTAASIIPKKEIAHFFKQNIKKI